MRWDHAEVKPLKKPELDDLSQNGCAEPRKMNSPAYGCFFGGTRHRNDLMGAIPQRFNHTASHAHVNNDLT